MNYLSFGLGIALGIALVLVPAYTVGTYLKKHPEIMVRRMTRHVLKGNHAPDNVPQ